MQMALKVNEMRGRLYVDCQLKIFCYTIVPLKRSTHVPIEASEFALQTVAKALKADGFTQCTRQAFETHFRK